MYDPMIREILRSTVLEEYLNDPQSRVLEELGLPVTGARIDIAVVNGKLHGYEIKSASDSLQRLTHQMSAYSRIFDFLTIVTEEKHCQKVRSIVPEWVGVSVVGTTDPKSSYEVIQKASLNQETEPFFVARLLKRNEMVDVLTEHKIRFSKRDRLWILCETLADSIEPNILSEAVRHKIKCRYPSE